MTRWHSQVIALALEETAGLYPALLNELARKLNDYHEANRGAEYYDVFCGDWLLHFVHVVYAAYGEVVDEFPGGDGPDGRIETIPVAIDGRQFLDLMVRDSSYSDQIRRIARTLAASDAQPRVDLVSASNVISRCGTLSTRIAARAKAELISSIAGRGAEFVICNPHLPPSRAEWIGCQLRWRRWARHDDLRYDPNAEVAIDSKWRQSMDPGPGGKGVKGLIERMLPLYLPTLFLEGFEGFRGRMLDAGIRRPRVLYTATALHFNNAFKLLGAEWRMDGTKVFCHQHGGGYGLNRYEPIEEYERRVADRFFSLGWSDPEDPRVCPLPQPLPARRGENTSTGVLLNLVSLPKQVYRIQFTPMPGTIEQMIHETTQFVRRLPENMGLTVRPFSRDYGYRFMEMLSKARPDLVLDDLRVSGPVSYARASLVVHCYLGTSWLETMAMDVPTICFYDPTVYSFRSGAVPLIAALEAVGVLHTSGEAAARHLAGIAADVNGWWQQADVREARQRLVERYANYSSSWAADWEREFCKWL